MLFDGVFFRRVFSDGLHPSLANVTPPGLFGAFLQVVNRISYIKKLDITTSKNIKYRTSCIVYRTSKKYRTFVNHISQIKKLTRSAMISPDWPKPLSRSVHPPSKMQYRLPAHLPQQTSTIEYQYDRQNRPAICS